MATHELTFQEIIHRLLGFWMDYGCVVQQPYDLEVGAGTMHPETFLRVLGRQPYKVAYVQPSRRPTDGRYGENPNRLYRHSQLQVILKPAPDDIQDVYLESLKAIGIPLELHDLRFEEDNWESPTLGAWGIGWQVLLDGLEITQFTYFQQAGGQDLMPISGEITYGLERIATFVTGKNSVYDLRLESRHLLWRGSTTGRARVFEIQLRDCRQGDALRAVRTLREGVPAVSARPNVCFPPTTTACGARIPSTCSTAGAPSA